MASYQHETLPPRRSEHPREMVLLLTGYLSWRALRARRDELGLTLRRDEVERLASLEEVFGGDEGDDCMGRSDQRLFLPRLHERHPLALPVTYRASDGEPNEGTLRNVSTGGFFLHTQRPVLSPGDRVTVKFRDEEASREWQFAGEMARPRRTVEAGMGFRFVGIPFEVRLGHSAVRSSLFVAA